MEGTENQINTRYDAFISYSRRDSDFARKLEKALDNYKPPKIPGLPRRRLKIFRDENDLIGADYGEAIEKNIRDSKKLILICSPNAAGSSYVNDEIQRFAIKKGAENLIPILISGLPSNEVKAGQDELNAFPPALTEALEMPLAIDYRNSNIDRHKINGGVLKGSWYSILARILDVSREQIEERDRLRQRKRNIIAFSTTFLILSVVLTSFYLALKKSNENAKLKNLDRNYTLAKSFEVKAEQAMDSQSDEGYKKAWLYTLAALSQVDTSRDMSLSRGRLSRSAISFGAGINQKIWVSPCPPGRQYASAISADRSLLALAGDDGQIHILNLKTGEEINAWKAHEGVVNHLDFNPAGDCLASSGSDGKITCWYLAPNDSVTHNLLLYNSQSVPAGISFDKKGDRLITLVQDSLFSIKIQKDDWWSAVKSIFQTGIKQLVLPKGTSDIKGSVQPIMAANRARTQIMIGLPNGNLGRVDTDKWKFIQTKARISEKPVTRLISSEDGESIIAVYPDSTIRLVSTSEFNSRVLFKNTSQITQIAENPAGTLLAAGSGDGMIHVWKKASENNWTLINQYPVHRDTVDQIQFLSDEQLLSASSDGVLQILQVPEGRVLAITTGHQAPVNTVAFSPALDNQLLASGDDDGLIIIWDAKGHEYQRLERRGQIVESISFNSTGKIMASGTKSGSVYIWDVETGVCLDSLTRATDNLNRVWDVAFGRGDSVIAIAMDRNRDHLYLWNPGTGSIRAFPDEQTKGLKCLQFTHDGKYLVTGSRDSTLCLWDVQFGVPLRRWHAHSDQVFGVDISPNDSLIASASKDEMVYFWNLKNILHTAPEKRIQPDKKLRQHFAEVWDVKFSPDGKVLASASADQTIRMWSVENGVELVTLRDHNRDVFSVAFSANGNKLASGSFDKTVGVWDVKNCVNLEYIISSRDTVASVAFSKDGNYFAYGGYDKRIHMYPMDSDQDRVNTRTPKKIKPKYWDWSGILSVSFSPDNEHLAYGSLDNRIRLWDFKSEKKVMLLGHNGDGFTVDFSSDSVYLASGSSDGVVRIWNMDSVYAGNTNEWEQLEKHQNKIRCVKFNHSSNLLASGSSDKSIFLWKVNPETERWSFLRALEGHSDGVWSLDFNSQDRIIASGSWDGTIRLWQVDNGRKLATLRGSGGPVLSVVFKNDSSLFSGYYDGSVRVWDLKTGQEIENYKLHSAPLYSIALSPKQTFLATGSGDRSIRLTELNEKTTSLDSLNQSDYKLLFNIFARSLAYKLDSGFLRETNQISLTPVNGYQFPETRLNFAGLLEERPLGVNPLSWVISMIKQKQNQSLAHLE